MLEGKVFAGASKDLKVRSESITILTIKEGESTPPVSRSFLFY